MFKKYILLPALLLCLQAFNSFAQFTLDKSGKHSVCIVIPAYNEEDRISRTLKEYAQYFRNVPYLQVTLLVVANNCSDDTVGVAKQQQKKYNEIKIMNLIPGGKGFAVKEGYIEALKKDYDLIGFVDADMATEPQYYHDLIIAMNGHDGAIASRYCKGANLTAERPLLRKVSGKIFNWVIQKRFQFSFEDTQCGAKIFTYDTIKKITPDMHEQKWYFDVEMLYLCTINGKDIVEVPTTWEDQPGSHLQLNGKLIKEFLNGQSRVLKRHKEKANAFFKNQRKNKRIERTVKKEEKKQKKLKQKELKAKRKAQKLSAKKARLAEKEKQRKNRKKNKRYAL